MHCCFYKDSFCSQSSQQVTQTTRWSLKPASSFRMTSCLQIIVSQKEISPTSCSQITTPLQAVVKYVKWSWSFGERKKSLLDASDLFVFKIWFGVRFTYECLCSIWDVSVSLYLSMKSTMFCSVFYYFLASIQNDPNVAKEMWNSLKYDVNWEPKQGGTSGHLCTHASAERNCL